MTLAMSMRLVNRRTVIMIIFLILFFAPTSTAAFRPR